MSQTKQSSVAERIQIERLTSYESMLEMFPLIQQLNSSMSHERYAELLRAIVKQGNYFQVAAYENGKCLGVAGIWIGMQLWCGKFLEIDNFVVDAAARGLGIGQKLMDWAEALAREEGCEMIRLDTYSHADKAQRFYFARGFKIQGFHMTKVLGGHA